VEILSDQRPDQTKPALQGLTLELHSGDWIGLVGPSGAGKSTLLRIIAGIYRPSVGHCHTSGRVACFLEPTGGLVPALSVLENLFLYAAMVGFSRWETFRLLEEILATAELEDWRHFRLEQLSFGQQQRLSLIIMVLAMRLRKADLFLFDECMAGLDYRFRQKCEFLLSSMRGDHTAVFATHDLALLSRLCPRSIYLAGGQLRCFGQTEAVITQYLAECTDVLSGTVPSFPGTESSQPDCAGVRESD